MPHHAHNPPRPLSPQNNPSSCKAFHSSGVIDLCLLLLDKGTDPSKSSAVKTLGNLCCDRDARSAVSRMDTLPPLVTSLCRAKDPDVQIGSCQCIALAAADPATAAAYVAAGAAAGVCALLKGSPETVSLAAAAAAAALTAIAGGAQQFVDNGGVSALKKAVAFGDSVKVAAVRALHQCVALVPEAAVQARDAGWLVVAQELLAAPPAVAVEAAYACARLACDATNRQQLTDLNVHVSVCSSVVAAKEGAGARIALLLAVAELARDCPDNVTYFMQQGAGGGGACSTCTPHVTLAPPPPPFAPHASPLPLPPLHRSVVPHREILRPLTPASPARSSFPRNFIPHPRQ